MTGGNRCGVQGCSCVKSLCRGISVCRIPPQSTEWGRRTAHLCRRSDRKFNPAKAFICTRHYNSDDLVKSGNGWTIKKDRLPSRFLPEGSCDVPRKEPRRQLEFLSASSKFRMKAFQVGVSTIVQ